MLKKVLLSVIVLSAVTTACHRNAITGRSQLSIVPESEMQSLALTQYKEFIDKNKVIPSPNKDAEMVKRVGSKIADAITKYYAEKGIKNQLSGYKWEFNLVDSKEVNAWCMPGGKVVVYTGLLPYTQNEAALAVVLGHEITHAVAGHGRERMSQQLVAQGLGVVGGAALSGNSQAVNVFTQLYTPTAQVGVLLPNSRKQESEADHFGLIFAAIAGYDPAEAVPFWKRMAAMSGQKQPIWLSDHPADEQRIKDIQRLLPEAEKCYHPSTFKP